MRRPLAALGALVFASVSTAASARAQYIDVQLVAASATPEAGRTILLGLKMNPRGGWHGYWSNPGESGLAPRVRWQAPPGVHFGPLQHPAPTLLNTMGLSSYVHSGPHILLTRMTVDRTLRKGADLPIAADVSFAACSDKLCVPEKAHLFLRLRVGNGARSGQARQLRTALANEPKAVRGGSFTVTRKQIVLRLPPSAKLRPTRTRFFPDENGYWDPLHARLLSVNPIVLVSPADSSSPKRVSGVVSDGSSSYRVSMVARDDGSNRSKAATHQAHPGNLPVAATHLSTSF